MVLLLIFVSAQVLCVSSLAKNITGRFTRGDITKVIRKRKPEISLPKVGTDEKIRNKIKLY